MPYGQHYLQISISKKYNTPVVAYPILKEQKFSLPPAGAIFPINYCQEGKDRITLTWEMGFPAYIFERLLNLGVDISTFNSHRFIDVIDEKSTGDPWSLNAELIMQSIAVNNFRKTHIKKAPCSDIILIIGIGSWFLESPFSPIYNSDDNDILYIEGITEGFHRLFKIGSSRYIDLYITDNECIIFSP